MDRGGRGLPKPANFYSANKLANLSKIGPKAVIFGEERGLQRFFSLISVCKGRGEGGGRDSAKNKKKIVTSLTDADDANVELDLLFCSSGVPPALVCGYSGSRWCLRSD